MKIKSLIFTILYVSISIANDTIDIKPIIDMRIQYQDKHKDYTPLGKIVKGKDSSSDGDYLIGGKFGFETSYKNYDLGVALHGIAQSKDEDEALKNHETKILNNRFVGYSYFGDTYIKIKFDNISTKIGRQGYNTSLVNKNERLTTNSYNGLLVEYKKDDLKIDGFYFNKVAASELSTTVPQNNAYGILGYGMGYNVGEFTEISKYIINKDKSTQGALNLNIQYGDDKTHFLIENLFVDNFFNTLSVTGRYNISLGNNDFNTKLGIVTQKEVGDNHFEQNIDSKLYQARFKFSKDKFYIAYRVSQSKLNKDAIYNGTLITPFSNKPAWIRGSQTAHAFIADTFAQQVILSNTFYLEKMPFTFIAAHIKYDIGEDNGIQNSSMVTRENYIYLKTYFSKNLTLTTQYSRAKNIDIFQDETKKSKIYLSYKF